LGASTPDLNEILTPEVLLKLGLIDLEQDGTVGHVVVVVTGAHQLVELYSKGGYENWEA
jgi:hypothetical protein